MNSILVAIANPEHAPLPAALVAELSAVFATEPRWLAAGEAMEMTIGGHDPASIRRLADERVAGLFDPSLVDLAILPEAGRRKRLLISDMDSTMITVECIDELADFAGVKSDVSAITRRAMNGELDFEAALRERVGLLAGLPLSVIDDVYTDRVRMMPGARILVQTMRRFGALTALVSGGFTAFADRVADDLGFGIAVANRLETSDGRLTGRVLAPIVGADTKLSTLRQLIRSHDLRPDDTLAVGDGANDLPMLQAAGFGVAFRPHQALVGRSDFTVQAGDLTALLYLQGVPKDQFLIN